MNEEIRVIPLTSKDIFQLNIVLDDYEDDTPAFMNLSMDADDLRRVLIDLINDFGETDSPCCFGVFDGDELCGVCTLMDEVDVSAHVLSNVFIKKDRRNEGLGTGLVKEVCSSYSHYDSVGIDFMTDKLGYFYRKCGFNVDMGKGVGTYFVERSISR